MRLNLSSGAWQELVDLLVDRGAIANSDAARTGYFGRGERDHGIGFTVYPPAGSLKLGAALAEAFSTIDELVEMAADGYGVHDFLRQACTDNMGRGTIVYFPGHKAQGL